MRFARRFSRPSLLGANGSRECAPDDRLRDEAIRLATSEKLDCFASLAMTGKHGGSFSLGIVVLGSQHLALKVRTAIPKKKARRESGLLQQHILISACE